MYRRNLFQTFTVVFLVFGCIIMFFLIMFPQKIANPKEVNNKENDYIDDEETNEEINIEGEYVEVKDGLIDQEVHPKFNETLLDNILNVFNNDFTGNYFGYYYKQDNKYVKDMDKNVLLNLALQKFADDIESYKDEKERCVDKQEIINYYSSIFEKDVVVEDLNEKIFNETGDFYYKDGKYCGKALMGKDPIGYNVYQKVIGYNKGSLYLEIFTKYTFCQVMYNESTKLPDCIYRKTMDIDSKDNILGRTKFAFIPSKEIQNKSNTIKYTFKMKGNNLYFYSVENI